MITPLQSNQALLDDLHSVVPDEHTFHVWWLGQSGFLVKWYGHSMIFDPYLSDSLTRKYDSTDQPHVRMSERAVDPHRLMEIRVVTSSHNHTDHLDAETLLALTTANPGLQLVLPSANVTFANDRLGPMGPDLTPVDSGDSVEVGPWTFHGITAAHNEVEHDAQGCSKYLGYVMSFGDFSIYHSGDTLWHKDLVGELRRHGALDLALLPINGNKPARHVSGNLNGVEAAALAKAIGVGTVVPCHYGLFEFNTETPEVFVATCEALQQPHNVMQCGERLTITAD